MDDAPAATADAIEEETELAEGVTLDALAEEAEPATPLVDGEEDDAVDALDGKNPAASFGFEERKPAAKSAFGHPDLHGFDLQHPKNGGDVPVHVYQLPLEHCWSEN